ncbi:MAG: hypothetical protein K2Q01_10410 [Rickettsiales bacterium]|nr:hypothetical protein [Rickettsiales bacterium]
MNKQRLLALSMVILAAAASRLLPHPQNVAPIAAIALFAGSKFERKWLAFTVPATALLLSDAVIGFYERMWVVYAAFAVVVCMGFLLRSRENTPAVLLASLSASVAFFLITNLSLLGGHIYPAGMEGVVASYTAGLPFFQNTLLGDLFYSAVLFGGFALAEKRFTPLRPLATA